jgi:hypothetical protein
VSFDYLANLRKLKKKTFFLGMGGGNEEIRGNEEANQGVRERKKVWLHCCTP